jgi:transposase-like protein
MIKERERITYKYSRAFKLKVVGEIESGRLTKNQAKELYGIKGGSTLTCWIKKMGKDHLLNKIVRIELKNEPSIIKQLEKEKQALERALSQAHLKLLAYESLIEVADEELGTELKKNLELKLSNEPKPEEKKKRRQK